MKYKLEATYQPKGDQPRAIKELTDGILRNIKYQTFMGVTGSGKTFSISKVIENVGKPVLIMSHNKTLAAQLFGEFKRFFPENKVEFFISYYDYYQPEAYIPSTDTYIAKDLSINEEIDRLRLRATASLLEGRKGCYYSFFRKLYIRNRCSRGIRRANTNTKKGTKNFTEEIAFRFS